MALLQILCGTPCTGDKSFATTYTAPEDPGVDAAVGIYARVARTG